MNRPAISASLALALACGCRAEVTLIGRAFFTGDATDKCPFTEDMGSGVPQNRLGGLGSAIDFTGRDDLYIACVDRGPADGAAPFRDRFETIRIRIEPGSAAPVTVELVGTTMLADESGMRLTGRAAALNEKNQRMSSRFDAEGIRLGAPDRVWISDEYGPWIDEFTLEGRRTRRLAIPAKFLALNPSVNPEEELPPTNTRGRQPNRGFEGLAINRDRTRLWAMPQSPLIQDGAVSQSLQRVGRNIRMLQIDPATGATAEFVYVLESPAHGVNEALAVSDRELLVLERDGKKGDKARSRALYRVDLSGATDVSGVETLPTIGLPEGVRPVAKKMWLDFTDPRFGLAGASMPEKIEGLTFGPALADGRRTLIVTTDNDFRVEQPTWVWVFAFDAADLGAAATK